MTTEKPTVQEQVATLEQRWSGMQEGLLLKDVLDSMEDVQTTLTTLPLLLEQVRQRGYVFKSFLERKVKVLQDQWAPLRVQVEGEVSKQTGALRVEANRVDAQFNTLRRAVGSPAAAGMIPSVDLAVGGIESKISAARSTLTGMFDELKNNVDQTKRQLDEIVRTLDACEQASFRLLAGEDIVLVVPAQWDKDGKDDPKGNLFLTDSRMLFERNEEVATKKVLFVTTAKEKVQQLQLEVVLPDVETVKATSKGMFGKDDWLEFTFQGRAPCRTANFHIWYESNDWQALYGRVKSGEIAQERSKPKDAAVVEAVKSAPTKCPTCGASLNIQIVKGMTQVNCDYCGSVIRL